VDTPKGPIWQATAPELSRMFVTPLRFVAATADKVGRCRNYYTPSIGSGCEKAWKESIMPAKSKKQQMAAGAPLAAKRGRRNKSSLKGASKSMYKSMD